MRTKSFVFILLIALAATALAADKAETIGALDNPGASPAVKQALQDQGYRLTVGDNVLAEMWLAKSAPLAAKPAAEGLFYPQFTTSEFLGVITFPQASRDFRNDLVKPGTYTMRYELIPNDGNHLGVSPNRDFVLLSPIADDKDPAATFKFDDMVAMSKLASGIKHPQPFCLVDPPTGAVPKLWRDTDNDYVIFAANVGGEGGKQVPVSFVVKGQAQQ